MTELTNGARAWVQAAAQADSAPDGHFTQGRQRLIASLAAGAISATAVVSQGAPLAATGAVTTASPSILTTLVSAVAIGVSTGLVAVSPTSRLIATVDVEARPTTRIVVKPTAESPTRPTGFSSIAPKPGAFEASVDVPYGAAAPRANPATLSPPASAVGASAASKPNRTSIATETALLAEAQRALREGHAAMALDTLDHHAAQYPGGALQEEATASRVVALCAMGRIDDGRRWANEFSRRFPASPLSPRVHRACWTETQRSADVDAAGGETQ